MLHLLEHKHAAYTYALLISHQVLFVCKGWWLFFPHCFYSYYRLHLLKHKDTESCICFANTIISHQVATVDVQVYNYSGRTSHEGAIEAALAIKYVAIFFNKICRRPPSAFLLI